MKRSKILSLFALLLSALMLFSACGSKKFDGVKDILDQNAKVDAASVYSEGEAVADLKDATHLKSGGDLALFTKPVEDKDGETEWLVYNLKANQIVCKETATDKVEVSVDLMYNSYYEAAQSFFTVTVATKGEGEKAKTEVVTTLYDKNGTSVATADYAEEASDMLDLIYFDGNCYRVDANGGVSKAFAYSPLARLPEAGVKVLGHYYEMDDETATVTVYDDKLNYVAKYKVEYEDVAEVNFTVLENGNVFIQYSMQLDSHADEYDVLVIEDDESVKYDYVSQILDIKKNTVKDVNCDYVIWYGINLLEDNGYYADNLGVNTESAAVIGYGCKIVDQRLTDRVMLSIDEKGNVSELGEMNGSPITSVSLFDTNRWVVGTLDERAYIVDGEGNAIGEVTNVEEPYGKLLYADGKLYNSDLSVVKNLTAEGWQLDEEKGYYSYDGMILLEGLEGEVAICSQSGEINVLTDKDSNDTVLTTAATYVIVAGEKEYKVYNKNGEAVLTITIATGESNLTARSVYTCDDAALLMVQKTVTTNGSQGETITQETVYYRLG